MKYLPKYIWNAIRIYSEKKKDSVSLIVRFFLKDAFVLYGYLIHETSSHMDIMP